MNTNKNTNKKDLESKIDLESKMVRVQEDFSARVRWIVGKIFEKCEYGDDNGIEDSVPIMIKGENMELGIPTVQQLAVITAALREVEENLEGDEIIEIDNSKPH